MSQHGHFHWNELNTRNIEVAKAFYGATIGWSFAPMDMGGGGTYWLCMAGEAPIAGIFDINGPEFEGVPEHWFTYVAVDDIDAVAAKVVGSGGTLVRPVFDVPGVGRIAIVADPGGAVQGWMTPAPMPG